MVNWVMGNDQSVKLRIDAWISDSCFGIPSLNVEFAHLIAKPVSFLCDKNGNWNADLINMIFVHEDALCILHSIPPHWDVVDRRVWTSKSNGQLSLKDIYKYNFEGGGSLNSDTWWRNWLSESY